MKLVTVYSRISSSRTVVLSVALLALVTGGLAIRSSQAAVNCTTTVSSTAAAQTALSNASTGSTICISNGNYGDLTLNSNKSAPGVTVRAQNPGQTTLASASISGSYITVSQFNFTGQITIERNAHHITIFRNSITGGYMGILANPGTYNYERVKDITIRGNKIYGPLGEDGIRANQYDDGDGDGKGLLVEGNEFTKIIENGNHSDCLQTVWLGDDLIFKYNYLHDNRCQGFFVKDHGTLNTAYGDIGVLNNIKVENNLFTRNNEPCAPQDPNCGQPSYFQIISPVNNLSMTKNTIWGGDLNTTLRNMDSDTSKSYNAWGPISVTNNVINRIWSDFPSIFGSNYSASNNIRGNTYNGSWPTTGFTANNNPGFPGPTLAAGDDFRLNNGNGVTWKPSDCIFGPSDAATPNCPWDTGGSLPPSPKRGDINNDGVVDYYDLSTLLTNYGQQSSLTDLNSDGKVDIFDLSILLSNYGK